MKKKNRLLLVAILAVCVSVAGLLTGCKTTEAKSAGFTDSGKMANDPSLPFHKVWRKAGVNPAQYTNIYIADVIQNTC